jgi:SOS-response transcriptional repressor LexA
MIDVPLTKKQAELRILIDRMTRRYGYTPTINELSQKTGKSFSQVHRLMAGLVERGAAEKVAGRARAFKLL